MTLVNHPPHTHDVNFIILKFNYSLIAIINSPPPTHPLSHRHVYASGLLWLANDTLSSRGCTKSSIKFHYFLSSSSFFSSPYTRFSLPASAAHSHNDEDEREVSWSLLWPGGCRAPSTTKNKKRQRGKKVSTVTGRGCISAAI